MCTGATYTVLSGDSWSRIAQKLGVGMSSLLAANGATTSTVIFPGRAVCVPAGATPPTTTHHDNDPDRTPTAPTTTPPPPAPGSVTISQFPVQGQCWFADTWRAPRSGGRLHEGVDIIAKAGLYVYAVADGTLIKQSFDFPGSLSGNGWHLLRADGTYFFYAHLSAFAPGLKKGSTVKAGQIIGYVGKTGNAGSPHVHFEVHPLSGAAVNPYPIVKAIDACSTTAGAPAAVGSRADASAGSPLAPETTAPTAAPTPRRAAPAAYRHRTAQRRRRRAPRSWRPSDRARCGSSSPRSTPSTPAEGSCRRVRSRP